MRNVFFCLGLLCVACGAQAQISRLKQAAELAIKNSLVLKGDSLDVDLAHAEMLNARLRPNPNYQIQFLNLTNEPDFVDPTLFSPYNRQVWHEVNKQFILSGVRRRRMASALAGVSGAQAKFDVDINLLLFEVATAWMQLWYAEQVKENILNLQAEVRGLEGKLRSRKPGYTMGDDDRLKLNVSLDQLEMQRNDAEREIVAQTQDLQYLLNTTDSIAVLADPDPTQRYALPSNLDSLLQLAFDGNPNITLATAERNLATANVRLEKSLAYPIPQLGLVWNPQNVSGYAGINLIVPVPLFNRNQGNIAKAKITEDYYDNLIEVKRTRARRDINRAYQAYLLQQQNSQRMARLLLNSNVVLNLAEADLMAGKTNIQDYIVILQQWSETRRLQDQVALNLRTAYYELLNAMGKMDRVYR